jgi:serine/threonine protein phosphatase 1
VLRPERGLGVVKNLAWAASALGPKLKIVMNLDGKIIFAVPDIHGCHRAAGRAIEILERFDRPAVFLGDYIDRGESSFETVELLSRSALRHPDWVFLLGNHEDMFLEDPLGEKITKGLLGGQAWAARGRPAALEYRKRGQVPAHHMDFFKSCKLYHESQSFIFVHAGISEGSQVPLHKHRKADLLWTRSVSSAWNGKVVVHGHTIVDFPAVTSRSIGLDTGCFVEAHSKLTIGILDDESGRLLGTLLVSRDGSDLQSEFRV